MTMVMTLVLTAYIGKVSLASCRAQRWMRCPWENITYGMLVLGGMGTELQVAGCLLAT